MAARVARSLRLLDGAEVDETDDVPRRSLLGIIGVALFSALSLSLFGGTRVLFARLGLGLRAGLRLSLTLGISGRCGDLDLFLCRGVFSSDGGLFWLLSDRRVLRFDGGLFRLLNDGLRIGGDLGLLLFLLTDDQAAEAVVVLCGLARLREDPVCLQDSLYLYDLELIECGHVALDLAESETAQLGCEVLSGHAVVLGEFVYAQLTQSRRVSRG